MSKQMLLGLTTFVLMACAQPTEQFTPTMNPSDLTLTPTIQIPTVALTSTATPDLVPTPELMQGKTYREVARLDMKARILEIQLSPDQTRLAVLTWDGVYLYDAATLDLYWYHAAIIGVPNGISWIGNDEILVPREYGGYVINAYDGLASHESKYPLVGGVTVSSPGGKYIAKYSSGDPYTVYEAATGKKMLELAHEGMSELFWMPDSEHVVFLNDGDPLTIWNVRTGQRTKSIDIGLPQLYHAAYGAAFTPDGRYLAYQLFFHNEQGHVTSKTWLWDLELEKSIPVQELQGQPNDHNWSLDDQTILLTNGQVLRITNSGAYAYMTTLQYEYNSYFRTKNGFVVMLPDALMLYDQNFELVTVADGHGSAGELYTGSALSPTGKMMAIGEDTRFYVWDIDSGDLTTAFVDPEGFHGAFPAWSPSGKTLAIGTHIKGQVILWDSATRTIVKMVETRSHVCRVEWINEDTIALALTDRQSPDDESVCPYGSAANYLAIIDMKSGKIVYTEKRPFSIATLERSPDGTHLLWIEISELKPDKVSITQAVIWDTQSHRSTTIDQIWDAHWMPDSAHIVAPKQSVLRIIDASTRQERTIQFHLDDLGIFGTLLAVSDRQFVEMEYFTGQIRWYNTNGTLTSEDFDFWIFASDIIKTNDNRILVAVHPDVVLGSDLSVLLELLPAE